VSANDFRTGRIVYVVILGAVALALIGAARRLRGWVGYTDAFFPLALFWGDYSNFLWCWQLALAIPAALACVVLVIIVRNRDRVAPAAAVIAGVCLLLMPLCGAPGVAYVPALALWLGYTGVGLWRSHHARDKASGALIWALTAAALVVTGF